MRSTVASHHELQNHPPGSFINDKGELVRPRLEADPWFHKSQELSKLRAQNEYLIDDCRPDECVPEPDWAAEADLYYPRAGHTPRVEKVPYNGQPRSYLLCDLLCDAALMAPPAMLVAGLLRLLGITLFHGREKLGKSTFVAQLVAAITTGTVFLGQQLAPAFVVWVAADEPIQDAALRLKRYGANQGRVLIVDGRRGPDELAAELATAKGHADGLPLIVVVDTLAELVSPMITSENDSAPIIKALRRYIGVVREANAACVLIHHSNKSGSDYRGSQAIGGIVDAVAHFRERYATRPDPNAPPVEHDGPTDTRRVLEIRSRWAGHQKRHLTYDGNQYVLGDAPVPLAQRILAYLRESAPVSGSHLAQKLSANKQAVLTALNALESLNAVNRSGTGRHTVFAVAANPLGTEVEPQAQSGNAAHVTLGTEAEPQADATEILSVPDRPSVTRCPEPNADEDPGYWGSLASDAAKLELFEDAA